MKYKSMKCRHCGSSVELIFCDLGSAPPSNAYLDLENLSASEIWFPLEIRVCEKCWLVQTFDHISSKELFTPKYAYFSSVSQSWLEHCRLYASRMIAELSLGSQSLVIELACNDGYLLKNFHSGGIRCLGVEPTKSTAIVARGLGIDVVEDFFGHNLSREIVLNRGKADLVIANNVYAHVPDIVDFTKGISEVLSDDGIVTIEFPHILNLIKYCQFDTIYHEHFSYLSLRNVCDIFKKCGLKVYDVEKLATHGGSLRIYGVHESNTQKNISSELIKLLEEEAIFGLQSREVYEAFFQRVLVIKNSFIEFLIDAKKHNKKVSGYGAAAKGNTFLNFSGIKSDLLYCVYDKAISKQGKFLPGSRIPILSPSEMHANPPDYIVIFPWNLLEEVLYEYSDLRNRGVKFVTAIPELNIV